MPETSDSTPEEILPPRPGQQGGADDLSQAETLLVKGPSQNHAAEDLDATIRVAAPVPRTGTSSQPRGWVPPAVDQLQQMLPQYDVSSFIARGGMGAVYRGTQKTLKRSVAIKVLPPEIEDGDLQFAERFKHEAQAMARLTHPNIVAVFDAGETPGGLLYFVMEFVEGTDVARLISSEGLLEPERAISITVAVCEALAFAHEEGIVHRDIKPSNIMIDKRGRVKVADFGLAKSVNVEATLLTGTHMAMGTPDFIAPEALIPGIKIDGRADLYAVGVMLYQMLTGKIPRGRFQLPSGVVPQIDPRFDAIVDKAMQTDRDLRYSTAIEIKTDVEKVRSISAPPVSVSEKATPETVPQPAAAPPARRDSSGKGKVIGLTFAVILVVVAGLLVLKSREISVSAKPGAAPPAVTHGTGPKWQKPPTPDATFLTNSGASINAVGEWITPKGLTLWQVKARNIGIRGELKRMPNSAEPLQVILRHGADTESGAGKASRGLVLYPSLVLLQLNRSNIGEKADKEYVPLVRSKYPPGVDAEKQWVPFEYAVVGDASMARLAGVPGLPAGHSPDGLKPGSIQLQGGQFRNLEYIVLDDVSEDKAWDILGMKPKETKGSEPPEKAAPLSTVIHIPGLPDLPPLTIPPGKPGFVKEINFKGAFLHRFNLLPDCRRLLVYQDLTITLVDLETEKVLWSKAGGACRSSSVSKDGSRVAEFRCLDAEGKDVDPRKAVKALITLRSTSDGQAIQNWTLPFAAMSAGNDQLALSPSGKKLVVRVGGYLENETRTPCLFAALAEGRSDPIAQWSIPDHWGHVTSCLDEDRFVSTGNGAPILLKISDAGHFEPLLHDLAELRNAISPDQKVIVARLHDESLALWDIESRKRLFFLEKSPTQAHAISFAGPELVVAVGDEARQGAKYGEYPLPLAVWDRRTGRRLIAYTPPQPDQRFCENVKGAANGTFCVVRVRHYPPPPGGEGNAVHIYRLPKPGEVHEE